ncbi:MAG TPA: NAD(P)-dependent alcohol dehydrogenase [Candidatus Polarisedimenticolaceae bacterium]|nr:NAD(P)-dependent alcohol dehydrogenase [Candidatus Polarisedimenticolaceae bacterium]
MRAVEIRDRFGLEQLALTERATLEPGPGQIRLRLAAAALNYRDLLMVRGQYNPRQPLPLIPGSDGVGRVAALGPGVTRVAAGDRVAPIFAQRWIAGEPTRERLRSTLGGPLDGTFAEELVVDAESVVRVPEPLTDVEAATLPCAAVTAWNALFTQGELEAGTTVLVQGTGGVALFALQFARLAGARVIVTSSRDDKLERARQLGAWETINYRAVPDWGKQAQRLTDGRGVDLVIELGGAGTLAQSLAAVRCGGRVMLLGVLAGGAAEVSIVPVFMQQVRIQGLLVGDRESFERMNRAIAAHELRPVVDRVFPLAQAREALEYLAREEHFGKVCLSMAP